MTRICSYCDKPMGFKCYKCGGELEWVMGQSSMCESCKLMQNPATGGTTHGICDECAEKEIQK